MSRVLIVGGGVIGMLLAREMSKGGWQVSLFEKGICGREASWAGGGLVTPLYPWRYEPAITALASWSQDFYPQLAEELTRDSGIDPELSAHGMLMLSVADQKDALRWGQDNQRWLEPVDQAFIYQREPNLAQGFADGLYMPKVASIRNPRLGKSLRQALMDSGRVELYEQAEVNEIIVQDGRALGVRTPQGSFFGDAVVITSGAWSGELLQQIGLTLAVEPVKGQMILFKAPPGLLHGIVLKDGRYLIPRRDGRILCGSTLEHSGFDKTPSEAARAELYQTALDMLPALAECEVEAHWAGLRPGSPKGVPYIGAVPGVAGLYVNAGQYRNGLVLAPGSVRVLADELLERAPVIDPAPYRLEGRVEPACTDSAASPSDMAGT